MLLCRLGPPCLLWVYFSVRPGPKNGETVRNDEACVKSDIDATQLTGVPQEESEKNSSTPKISQGELSSKESLSKN